MMNVQKAAKATLKEHKGEVLFVGSGDTAEHARWMLEGISKGYIQHEKAHRWLGYAQAILVMEDSGTLSEMKIINGERYDDISVEGVL